MATRSPRRSAVASTLVRGPRKKITADCKGNLTIPVWPARPRIAENNESSHSIICGSRATGVEPGLAVITKVNNALPASNGVTPLANKSDSIYVRGMRNAAAAPRRVRRMRKRRDRYDNHGIRFLLRRFVPPAGRLHFWSRSLISYGKVSANIFYTSAESARAVFSEPRIPASSRYLRQ